MTETRTDALVRQLLLEKYEPIAVVGMGLRFPGDNESLDEFSAFLREGRSGTGPVPDDRWDQAALQSAEESTGKRPLAAGGGFVSGFDEFDPKFFNISPKEAEFIDPQHRWALESAWRALESAHLDPETLRGGNGGVYLGVGQMDFAIEVEALDTADLDAHVAAGTAHSAAAGRLSYFLGWRGPCMSVDTACSSSLVALHLAVQGLRRRECDVALAGGVNVNHHPRNHIVYSRANMLSPDGRCKTFDDSADGYARSEGSGMLVLKRLSDARRDGDTVLALVRGSAVRQDGESGGLTVPNGTAQAALMRAALESASLEPGDIQYVEAHGTGTSLGDPIEMGSINSVFADSRSDGPPLVVGSVKTNIGHMEAAAGIGGVAKVVCQLREGAIYPHINLQTPSRHIPWDRYRVTVPTGGPRAWEADGPRRALVNSFGFAGTIASVVIEQAPPAPERPAVPADGPDVFTLSAKDRTALTAQAERYRAFLAAHPDLSVADLCRTANVGRTHLGARLAGPVSSREDVDALLARHLERGDAGPGAPTGFRDAGVAFLLTGQGSQYPGMGRALYERYPVFRRHLDACDRLFAEPLGRSIKEIMFGEAPDSAEAIDRTLFTQPALFCLEYATARLWMSWGVRPTVLLGHSVGEIAAAALAGLFSLDDAVRLVAVRGRLMQSVAAPGGMTAVAAPAEEVAPLLEGYADVSFGAFNAPRQCVVSGGRDSLAEITAKLTERGVRTKDLPVSHAFHSPLMSEVFDAFREAIDGIVFHEPRLSFVSGVTGRIATLDQVGTADYWVRHIAEPVDFAAGTAAVQARGRHVFVEVGPSDALTGLGRRTGDATAHLWLTSTARSDTDATTIRAALARAYEAGLPVSWTGYHEGRPGHLVPLPGYVFTKKRYRLPTALPRAVPNGSADGFVHHPLLGREVPGARPRAAGEREFTTHLDPGTPAYLADHRVMDQVVFPGAGYVEILFALQDAVHGETTRTVRDVRILEPLFLQEDDPVEVRTRLRPQPGASPSDGPATVEIVSRVDGRDGVIERVHATATLDAAPDTSRAAALDTVIRRLRAAAERPGNLQARRREEELYEGYADLGLPYGPEFRRVRSVDRYPDGFAVGELRGLDTPAPEQLRASLLDCAMQTLGAAVDLDGTYLPVGFDRVELLKRPKGDLRVLIDITLDRTAGELTADIAALEGDRPVFAVEGVRLKRVAAAPADPAGRMLLRPRWVKRSLPPAKSAAGGREVLAVHRDPAALTAVATLLAEAGTTLLHAPDSATALRMLDEHPAVTDLCWFWAAEPTAHDLERLRTETERNYRDLLTLTDAAERLGAGRDLRVQLVTERAQWLPGDGAGTPDADALAPATLWGFGAVLLNEYPALRCALIDLDGTDLRPLADELLAGDSAGGDFQIAYRGGTRHVRRVTPAVGAGDAADDGNFELSVTEYGQFSAVRPVAAEDREPAGDEVTVQVHAAGLNFKDVLNALGMLRQYALDNGLPHEPLPLGFEAAGTVLAAGPDAPYRPGDEVVLSRIGCMRRRVTVPSAVVVRKPANLGFTEAAGLPAAYVTAYHALHHLAKIRAGDRVLIHAAAGGVGQAAVQLARLAGAEVFATASPRKWELLRSQGVAHIMNSRTLDFADEVLAATGGEGVDIVLNSLNKDYVPAGLRALAHGGRFVELGKIGIWSAERMRDERPDVDYHNFDLSELPPDELDRLNHDILTTVADHVEAGRLRALPTVGYRLDEVEEAFGVLSRGANLGKVVIDFRDEHQRPGEPVHLSDRETYLITGGLGALGRATAREMVRRGARRLALVSRGRPTAAQQAELAAALGEDIEVTVHQGDIAEPADVERIIGTLAAGDAPLGGVVHAAGVLADAPLTGQTWERMESVLRAKVYGTWLLHRAAVAVPSVRFFVGYSSIASVLGAAGQANYAAGNAFLDVLMQWRAAAGLPGLSVNWGPWAEIGMAASLTAQQIKGIEARGLKFVRPRAALRALFTALRGPHAQTIAGEFDWDAYTAAQPFANALFRDLVSGTGPARRPEADLDDVLSRPRAEREAALRELLRVKVAEVLRYDTPEDVDPDTPFVSLGLDSLASVELKNALEALLRIPLPASTLFDHPAVRPLAAFIDGRLVPEGPPADDPDGDRPGDVRDMTEAEADEELAALRESML